MLFITDYTNIIGLIPPTARLLSLSGTITMDAEKAILYILIKSVFIWAIVCTTTHINFVHIFHSIPLPKVVSKRR